MEGISKYVTFAEATSSPTALAHGVQNIPNLEQVRAMKMVARMCFDPVREHFGKPLRVNSFYRSAEANSLVGGSATSQHCKGEAIDISGKLSGIANAAIFHWLKENATFDQLIWEFGSDNEPDWVHVSYSARYNRGEVLKSVKQEGKTKYLKL